MNKWIWWIAGGVVILGGAGALYYLRNAPPPVESVAVPVEPTPITSAPEAAAIQNPVPAAAPGDQALPSLADSDKPLDDELSKLLSMPLVEKLVRPEMLVRHIVATVDNLSRPRLPVGIRPVKPVTGQFAATGDELHSTLNPSNYLRYAAYMQLVQKTDTRQLADLYFRYYTLFQQAYQDLGYPNGYFNDRLVATLDNLLATPDPPATIELVQPNVMYQFADPELEKLSAGQKILLRIGPYNASLVKVKLRELRALVAAKSGGSAVAATQQP
ncbi:MAG TPA: DUF3014 domain-containing protein [Steroidobacteraceae bacterium]|nr:DUF3014 domain-containing protein [Steroidobacteraceae bacterium]